MKYANGRSYTGFPRVVTQDLAFEFVAEVEADRADWREVAQAGADAVSQIVETDGALGEDVAGVGEHLRRRTDRRSGSGTRR